MATLKFKLYEFMFLHLIPNYFWFGTENKILNALWLHFATVAYHGEFANEGGGDG